MACCIPFFAFVAFVNRLLVHNRLDGRGLSEANSPSGYEAPAHMLPAVFFRKKQRLEHPFLQKNGEAFPGQTLPLHRSTSPTPIRPRLCSPVSGRSSLPPSRTGRHLLALLWLDPALLFVRFRTGTLHFAHQTLPPPRLIPFFDHASHLKI